MHRISLVLAGLLAVSGVALAPVTQAQPAAEGDRPNIILITTDDQTADDLRFMPFTRRLLGRQGVRFSDAIAPFPLCCPARATLVTGQLAHNNGVLSNRGPGGGYEVLRPLNDRTLPVWLGRAGYRTTFAGKYLNGYGAGGSTEIPEGWDNWHGSAGRVYKFFEQIVNENGVRVDRTGTYQADLTQDVTEQAIREGAANGQPFFVWQSNLAPHAACCRWKPPEPAVQDRTAFADLLVRRSASYDERAVADKPDHVARRAPLTAGDHTAYVAYHRKRAASLQAVDRNVRDTVALLEQVGELENTVLVFTSDNGFLLGQHRLFGKTVAYERSLKIPLLMRGPGIPSGARVDEMVSLVDVAATIADLARANPLLEQDGRSLMPVANGAPGYGAASIEAGSVMGARPGQFFYRGVRTPRYTYVEYPQTDEAELYDRKLDPHQLNNAAYRPTHRETRRALTGLLAQLRSCAGVDCTDVAGPVPAPRRPPGPVHPDELTSVGGATQVVTVTSRSWGSARGRAVAWQKRDRSWRAVRSFPVTLGRQGMVRPGAPAHERDRTQAGSFRPVRAFGTSGHPGAKLSYRRVGEGHRWVLDPRSARTYNVLQPRRPAAAEWRRGLEERFAARPDRFRHVVVLDHNLPRRVRRDDSLGHLVAGQPADVRSGSLLLHTGGRAGRHGWIAADPTQTRWLLRWMAPARHGTTIVVGPVAYLRNRL